VYGRFLPRDAAKRSTCRRRVSVCVCVPVTLWYCMKTAKRRITPIMPHDRPRPGTQEISYLVYRLTVASPSRRTTNRPWKGHGYVTWHVLNFGCNIHISGMAQTRALKLCTKVDYVRSGQRDDKPPLKRAWFCSRDPFFVCIAVELEKNLHCTRWLRSIVS